MMIGRWLVLLLAFSVGFSAFAEERKPSSRIAYADMLLNTSATAKRFEEVGSEEAKEALKGARELLENAQKAWAEGNDKQAEALAGLAMRKFTAATQLLPKTESAQKVMRERYAEMMEEIDSYLDWYDTADYISGNDKATVEKAKEGIATAKSLYEQKQYEKANNLLAGILNVVVEVSNRNMTASEVVRSLDFATPQEEYEYEVGRNDEYKRLIPIAIDQKNPTGGRLMLIKRFAKQAEDTRTQADTEYANKDVEAAIKTLQASTDQYLKTLRMMGIR